MKVAIVYECYCASLRVIFVGHPCSEKLKRSLVGVKILLSHPVLGMTIRFFFVP